MASTVIEPPDNWAGRILTFLYHRKWLGIILLVGIMLLSFWGMLSLVVEADATKFLPKNTAERLASRKIKELYSIDTEMIIGYEATDIAEPKIISLITDLTNALQSLEKEVVKEVEPATTDASKLGESKNLISSDLLGESNLDSDIFEDSELSNLAFSNDNNLTLQTSLIQDIQSFDTISIMLSDGIGGLEDKEVTSLQGDALKQELRDWGLYEKILYNDDFRYGAIIIQPGTELTSDQYRRLYQEVVVTLESFKGKGLNFFLGGEAVIQSAMGEYILADLVWLIPLLALIVCSILYIYFRRFSALIIILFPVVFALLATIGLMGWLGVKFTFIHASIPIIIIALGSADSIHTLGHFAKQGGGNLLLLQRIKATQRQLLQPITLTSITTSIGFLSFAGSVMLPIRSFGLFNAAGIGFAWLSSLFIAPLLLPLYKPPLQQKPKNNNQHNALNVAAIAWNFTRLLARHPYITRTVFLCSAGLLLLIPQVPVNNDTISYFHPNSRVVKDSLIINDKLSGIYTIHISMEAVQASISDTSQSSIEQKVLEPEILQYMANLATYVKEQNPSLVNKTIGLQDFVLQLNGLLNPGRNNQTPQSLPNRQTIVQYLSLYSGNLDSFVSPDIYEAQSARVSIYLNDGSKDSTQKVLRDIEVFQAQHLPKGYKQIESGASLTINNMNQLVVKEQIRSIILAITGVFLIVLFSFRSLRLGLLACLPSTITLLLNLVLMALLQIDLDISTALINSLLIGVGIDYGIHLISAYRQGKIQHDGPSALQQALKQVSSNILLNAVAVGLGYMTLVFSQFRSLGYFGGLSALANMIAAALTLLILPLLLLNKKQRSSL